jgi:hypothetical protein
VVFLFILAMSAPAIVGGTATARRVQTTVVLLGARHLAGTLPDARARTRRFASRCASITSARRR